MIRRASSGSSGPLLLDVVVQVDAVDELHREEVGAVDFAELVDGGRCSRGRAWRRCGPRGGSARAWPAWRPSRASAPSGRPRFSSVSRPGRPPPCRRWRCGPAPRTCRCVLPDAILWRLIPVAWQFHRGDAGRFRRRDAQQQAIILPKVSFGQRNGTGESVFAAAESRGRSGRTVRFSFSTPDQANGEFRTKGAGAAGRGDTGPRQPGIRNPCPVIGLGQRSHANSVGPTSLDRPPNCAQ